MVTIACALVSCRFGGNAEQIRQVLTTPMTSDDMQQVMVTQVRPHTVHSQEMQTSGTLLANTCRVPVAVEHRTQPWVAAAAVVSMWKP